MHLVQFARLAVSVSVLLLTGSISEAAWARFTFNSQPGDWVGQGQVRDIIYDSMQGSEILIGIPLRLPTGEPTLVDFSLDPFGSGTYASLSFDTHRLGIPIQVGYYPDAQRARFAAAGHPGLDVGFQNRGCDQITGNFTITEVVFGPGFSFDHFAATFEQHCEGQPPALFGTFTYYAVPEPASFGVLASVTWLWMRRLRRS